MKAANYIAKKETKLLLFVALAAMLFVIAAFTLQIIDFYNHSVIEAQQELESTANGHGSGTPFWIGFYPIACLHFLTVFIFAALIKKNICFPFR